MNEAHSSVLNLETDWINSVNPTSLEICGRVRVSSHSDICGAVRLAKKEFSNWAGIHLAERAKIMRRAQQLLLERAESFACLITGEMGRPLVESFSLELTGAIDLMGFYIRNAKRFLRDRSLLIHNPLLMRRNSLIINEPLGVMGIISPWNWPLLIPMGCIVPALLAGNTVVFKPSEITPLTGIEIQKLFLDAGVPERAFHVIQGYASCGRSLLDSEAEKIFFTGSTEVGQNVMSRAAKSLKSAVLELGGNDPAIVCEDADIENCTSGILWGGFNNCGQNCNSIERVYVERGISDRFIDMLTGKVKKLRVGDGCNEVVDLGPVANEMQLLKMASIVERAVDRGGEILCGGHIMNVRTGYFFEPTLIHWKNSQNLNLDEEIFGPAVHVVPVSDIQQAVRLSNESSFGLAASVWTRNMKKGESIARQLESGSVMINDSVISFGISEASWTGVKKSGIGWTHGRKGMDEMINIKYVCMDTQFRIQKFWWFPYSQRMVAAMKKAMFLLFSRKIVKRLAAIPVTLRNFAGYLIKNRRRNDKW